MMDFSLVEGISLYRAYTLYRPLASRQLSPGTIHKILTGLFIFSVLYILGGLAMEQFYYFDPYDASCKASGLTGPKPSVIFTIIGTFIFLTAPSVGIIVTNIAILVMVARARGGVPGINAVKTVCCVSLVFLISILPTDLGALLEGLTNVQAIR